MLLTEAQAAEFFFSTVLSQIKFLKLSLAFLQILRVNFTINFILLNII